MLHPNDVTYVATDKPCCKLQSAAMHVTCPQCHATYQLNTDVHHALLVCHRCQTEFTVDDDIDIPASENLIPVQEIDVPKASFNAMHPGLKRKKTRMWPWLTAVLLIIAGLGVQHNRDIWLQQTWVRDILIQLHYPLQTQAGDWLLLRNQSHRQWMTRQDGSKVLILTGRIQNQLDGAQLLPRLRVQFYDVQGAPPTRTRTLAITMPPSLPQIRHAPYVPPSIDRTPIPAHGYRDFTLIFEHVPEQSRDISIAVSVK